MNSLPAVTRFGVADRATWPSERMPIPRTFNLNSFAGLVSPFNFYTSRQCLNEYLFTSCTPTQPMKEATVEEHKRINRYGQ